MEEPGFGAMLRRWRTSRGMSQAALASDAEVSTRHLSCLETGKARASREMVLVLASALDLPLRERNALLLSAGFAPAYASRPLDSTEMQHVRRALDLMLDRQEPYPAIVCDRAWNIRAMNGGAQRLVAGLALDATRLGPAIGNAMHILFHEAGIRRALTNFDEVAAVILSRLRRDARHGDEHAARLLVALCAYPGVASHLGTEPSSREPSAVLPLRLVAGDAHLALFTTLTTLGTPLDVTAAELKIESYFPADASTERWFAG